MQSVFFIFLSSFDKAPAAAGTKAQNEQNRHKGVAKTTPKRKTLKPAFASTFA